MRPQLWVIAGPNGAGKSTLVKRHMMGKIEVINPDDIAREQGISNRKAGEQALLLRTEILKNSRTFAVETTLTGVGEVKMMQQAAAAGYKINLIYVGIKDVGMSIARVNQRVSLGGHNVPIQDIFRRYERSVANLPKAMAVADRVWVFDNSYNRRRLLLSTDREKTKRLSSDLPAWFKKVASQEIEQARTKKKKLRR
ncbi:zeta toxin family protein [Salmonella enterica]|nr:zeta toxin family protein [Salmonella enterica]EIF9977207.1 zeta toxin family protein [Salmonella enterica]